MKRKYGGVQRSNVDIKTGDHYMTAVERVQSKISSSHTEQNTDRSQITQVSFTRSHCERLLNICHVGTIP